MKDVKKEGFPTSFGQFHDAVATSLMLEVVVLPCLPVGHSLFPVFPTRNRFGLWAAHPFSEAHQTTPPCISLDYKNDIAPIW